MTTILIDTSTILRNPEYGGFKKHMSGPRSMMVTTTKLSPEFKDGDNCYIVSWTHGSGCTTKYEIQVNDNELAEKIVNKEIPVDGYVIIRENIDVTQNEPQYLYEYFPAKIKCNECGWLVYYSTIADDLYDVCCPKCLAEDSFDFEYESIEDAITRAGLDPDAIPYAKQTDD